jgi:signal transduction histidine kinase/ActR/RegA family two-component response regulator
MGTSAAPGSQACNAESALQACVRDLMSLLALPALWSGREPQQILTLLSEALEAVLPIDVCYVTAQFLSGEEPLTVFRVRQAPASPDAEEWRNFLESCDAFSSGEQVMDLPDSPLGPLRVARIATGFYGYGGFVWVGSSLPAFPIDTHMVFLRAAASLAASGLRTARLVREREEAIRAKDEFLAMLGHELRNPLAPIVTALHLMDLRGADEPFGRERSIIKRQINHLVMLVDDLLDIARVTRGKIELRKVAVELSTIVAKAVETASPLLEQRRHRLHIDVPATGLTLDADAVRLSQVVSNLLVNAAKFTEPGGDVWIRALRRHGNVELSVKDNGCGINADLLPRVFDLFQQGSTTLDRADGGLGIGLALVKTFVFLHHGTVYATSAGPGHGSEFTVRLPMFGGTEPALLLDEPVMPTILDHDRERILVVDDNQDAADLLGATLQAVGHTVAVAYDSPQALLLAGEFRPTVAVMDIGLPVMDGYELATRIRQRLGKDAPRMIALSGYGMKHDRERSQQAGFDFHLVKPVHAEQLLATVHQHGRE